MKFKNKKAQEEMIGFAVIIIIVAVILLIFLAIFIRKPQKDSVESYEVQSFLQAMLQYTTNCSNTLEKINLQRVIFACYSNEMCLNGESACKILNNTLIGIVESSWKKEKGPILGYELEITREDLPFLEIKGGNESSLSRGGVEYFSRSGNSFEVKLEVYGSV
jgi:hypothetical protein